MEYRSLEELSLRLYGGDHDHMVDAETLSRLLTGLQRAVHIVAMDKAHIDVKSPNYVPKSIQDAYPVLCGVARVGSYDLPATVGCPNDLVTSDLANSTTSTILACLAGLVEGNDEPFANGLREIRYRMRLLDAFRIMLPKPGSAWKLGVSKRSAETTTEIELSGENVRTISVLKDKLRQKDIVTQTITGSLQAMDFKAKKVTILYPENNRKLECFYDDEVELELLDNRRDLVQVTGTVVVDRDSLPSEITDVESIQALDLSDFEIREFHCRGQVLAFKQLLTLSPELTESKQFITLRYDPLDIDVIAQTREQLLDELNEQLLMLWADYAMEQDDKLTPSARDLKYRLLDFIEVVGPK